MSSRTFILKMWNNTGYNSNIQKKGTRKHIFKLF